MAFTKARLLKHDFPVHGFIGRRNKEHPKTQVIDRSQNLRFGVCCVFGVFWRPLRGEQRAPESATHPKTQILENGRLPAFSGVLRFRVLS